MGWCLRCNDEVIESDANVGVFIVIPEIWPHVISGYHDVKKINWAN